MNIPFQARGIQLLGLLLAALAAAFIIGYSDPFVQAAVLIIVLGFGAIGFALYAKRFGVTAHQLPASKLNNATKPTPDFWSALMFVLLMSGPPTLRERDPMATTRGEIDAVIILNFVVWGLGGLWVLHQFHTHYFLKGQPFRIDLPQKLGVLLVFMLGVSTMVSAVPQVTAFRAYQLLVIILFASLFVQRFGVEACLRQLFVGAAMLSVAVTVAAVVAPDMVSSVSPRYGYRIRGDLIAQTAEVTFIGLILLLSGIVKLSRTTFLFLLSLLGTLFLLARSRTAIGIMALILVISLVRKPDISSWRRLTYAVAVLIPVILIVGMGFGVGEWLIRDTASLSTMSNRTILWTYLLEVTWEQSPWIGLGYYSASRIYGMESGTGLGTAHSVFFETLIGGGILSFSVLVLFWCLLGVSVIQLLFSTSDRIVFVCCSLYFVALGFSLIGAVKPGSILMVGWCLAAIFPILQSRGAKRAVKGAQKAVYSHGQVVIQGRLG